MQLSLRQLRLLLWKNFILRIRQPLLFMCELVIPLIVFVILLSVQKPSFYKEQCHFDAKAMPSAGLVPFVQSLICTIDNRCFPTLRDGERSGMIQTFRGSQMTDFLTDLEVILSDNLLEDDLANILTDLDTLKKVQEKLNGKSIQDYIRLSELYEGSETVRNELHENGIDVYPNFTEDLLQGSISPSVLQLNQLESASEFQKIVSLIIGRAGSGGGLLRNLHSLYCDTNNHTQWITYENPSIRSRVKEQICKLKPDKAAVFDRIMRKHIKQEKVAEMVKRIINDTVGREIKSNVDLANRLFDIYKKVRRKPSFVRLAKDLIRSSRSNLPDRSKRSHFVAFNVLCGRRDMQRGSKGYGQESSNPFVSELTDDKGCEREFLDTLRTSADELRNISVDDKHFTYNANLSTQCNVLIYNLQRCKFTRIIWRQMKPLVTGHILYTPDNQMTRRLISRTNYTFQVFERAIDGIFRMIQNEDKLHEYAKFLYDSTSHIDKIKQFLPKQLRKQQSELLRTVKQMLSFNETTQQSDMVLTLVDRLRLLYEGSRCFELNRFRPVSNVTDNQLEEMALQLMEADKLWAALVFETPLNSPNDHRPEFIKYRIRMPVPKVDDTFAVKDRLWSPGPRHSIPLDMKYFVFGFTFLQDMIEKAIIGMQTNSSVDRPQVGMYLQQFPYPCFVQYSVFTQYMGTDMPFYIVLSFIFTVMVTVRGIVYEKEVRLKEVMKMMGLKNHVHWIAWGITTLSLLSLSCLIISIFVKIGSNCDGCSPSTLPHSDFFLIFLYLLCFSVATTSFCFLLSTFFGQANLSAIVSGLIFFILYTFFIVIKTWDQQLSAGVKILTFFISIVAGSYGWTYFGYYEQQRTGLQWSNIAESPIDGDPLNLSVCMIMMLLDTLIYCALTWYIEKVFPGRYGIPQPWHFPFHKSFWCSMVETGNDADAPVTATSEYPQEPEPSSLPVGIKLANLTKRYEPTSSPWRWFVSKILCRDPPKRKLAIDELSLNLYENQITAFLGHNGAGKTTTMSIITGLYPPSNGTAYVYGSDVRSDMSAIRKSLGVCPQHNILFDRLTVEEHLVFYGCLKGFNQESVVKEAKNMIELLGLADKTQMQTRTLSGGMKRKLSVAVAFIGNAKAVILDEPTAGVDSYARRGIWEFLRKLRSGRTILLSTHHMDEANMIGDRIAIISQGRLQCTGSSEFLKSNFGSGYYVTFVKDAESWAFCSTKKNRAEENSVMLNSDNVTRWVGDSLFSATELDQKNFRLVHENNTELTFWFSMAVVPYLKDLLKVFGNEYHKFKLNSFGVVESSLEEVFLTITEKSLSNELETEERERLLRSLVTTSGAASEATRIPFLRKLNYVPLSANLRDDVSVGLEERQLIDYSGISLTDVSLNSDTASTAPVRSLDKAQLAMASSGQALPRCTGFTLLFLQFFAVLTKKFHHCRRSKKVFISAFLLPIIFIFLAIGLIRLVPGAQLNPPLELHPWQLSPTNGRLLSFFSNEHPTLPLSKRIQMILTKTAHGFGNRCFNFSRSTFSNLNPHSSESRCRLPEFKDYKTQTFRTARIHCPCRDGWQQCPASELANAQPKTYHFQDDSSLLDVTGWNVSDWLKKTRIHYKDRLYGGFSFVIENTKEARLNKTALHDRLARLASAANGGELPPGWNNGSILNFWSDLDKVLVDAVQRLNVKVWFNNKGWPAGVSYMNAMNNLLLRAQLPPSVNSSRYGISAWSHPLLPREERIERIEIASAIQDILLGFCVIIALSFLPATFVIYLVEERVNDSKHLQFVSGMNRLIYWLSIYLWDVLTFVATLIVITIIFAIFQQKAFISGVNLPCFLFVVFLYGTSITPLMYICAYLIDNASLAFVLFTTLNIIIGCISTVFTVVYDHFGNSAHMKMINEALKKAFLILPQYCLGRGLIEMNLAQLEKDIYSKLGEKAETSPFEFELVGRCLLGMFCMTIFFCSVLLLIDFRHKFPIVRLLSCISDTAVKSSNKEEDCDVLAEKNRIASGGAANDALCLNNLVKVYRPFLNSSNIPFFKSESRPAVDHVSLGVPAGECFGLLGLNGAGKSTIFKMLTGDIPVTSGTASVSSHSILSDLTNVHKNIGYCPQFDALDPLLTGREHLTFYARIRGFYSEHIPRLVDRSLILLGLAEFADITASKYSGGNKRKLSTAIALLGEPPVIFLDEPTTGMDPRARRNLWNCIRQECTDNRCVILTSHNMEECEALCSRIGIMVNGSLRCLGSIQHLKSRFGGGYMVTLQCKTDIEEAIVTLRLKSLCDHFLGFYPNAELRESHLRSASFQIRDISSPEDVARLFGTLETLKAKHSGLHHYSVTQTTLDQVFVRFAKQQISDVVDRPNESKDASPGSAIVDQTMRAASVSIPDGSRGYENVTYVNDETSDA